MKAITHKDIGLPSGTRWGRMNRILKYDFCKIRRIDGIPTITQWQELIECCRWKWLPLLKAYRVTGPNGRSILLPARGFTDMSRRVNHFRGVTGHYWSATKNTAQNPFAVYFYKNYINRFFLSRGMDRMSVRTVKK